MDHPTLLDVAGIGADRAGALADHGIRTLEQLAEAPVEHIAAVPGLGAVTARRSKRAAQELLSSSRAAEEKGKKGGKKEEMAKCGNCGELIPSNSDKCPKCGVDFGGEWFECPNCGELVSGDSTECSQCGAKFEVQ